MEAAADPGVVEQLAAALWAQAGDLSLYAGLLMNLASGALPPDLVEVEREKARFGRRRGEPAVTAVTVTLGEWMFRLERPAVGATAVAELRHVVGGIVLSRERIPLVPWSRRLAGELSKLVARDADASAAVERMLGPSAPPVS